VRPSGSENDRADRSLAVVIVNYNRAEMTAACVDAVTVALARAGLDAETSIVDNGSEDDSVEVLSRRFPEVRVTSIPANGPLPAALNRGWRESGAEWVLMLNNDILLDPEALALAWPETGAPERLGTVALEMRFASRPGVVNSSGIAVDRLGVPFDLRIGLPAGDGETAEVFGACGAAALYRRTMLDSVGGFDESFGFGFEDVDLSWRAQMLGWRTLVVRRAFALHAHGGTVSTLSPFRARQAGLNRIRLLAKHAPMRMLVRYGVPIALYDLAYVGYVGARQRTLAPLHGRLQGLREWRRYRRLGAVQRHEIELAPVRGVRAALARRAAWSKLADRTAAG
jgi:GT2 family glycosyltransferase